MARRVKSLRDQFDFSKGAVQLGTAGPGQVIGPKEAFAPPTNLDRMGGFGPPAAPAPQPQAAAPEQAPADGPAPLVPPAQQAQPDISVQIAEAVKPLSGPKPQASIRKSAAKVGKLRMPTFRRGGI